MALVCPAERFGRWNGVFLSFVLGHYLVHNWHTESAKNTTNIAIGAPRPLLEQCIDGTQMRRVAPEPVDE